MPAPREIIDLIDKFERHIDVYKSNSFKEEQLKQEFINPFFKALGWDVDNTSGKAPQYRDVIFEDSIKVGGGTKAPDYCFTLAGQKMFFVEAKRASVNIATNKEPAFQLRRYAWSAKLPLSILTDFEDMAIYDPRTKPKNSDNASISRIKFLNYKDYIEQWDYLYNTFSKEAVEQGLFDLYAASTKKKKGTSEVDDEFLSEIESWRELLARNIAIRNRKLTVEELNYSVQQIIDRIIFLRMCEDRGIEKYKRLENLLDSDNIYQGFVKLCLDADDKYNSGLFHFKEEKNRPAAPDNLTLGLKIDDNVLKKVIKKLYYPDSPYEFSVLQPEILGNVYEQFLGKVIRLTPSHQAKIEEKPEVKKAGGVYYTPEYIVKYIVDNTVGKLCKGKTPNKVSKLKILDPACGSGSFLLGAYKYLLQWHRDYYSEQKDKRRLKDKIYQSKNGEWFLTIQEKKRILLNNIYGVDIDSQAVNVTKLSLLLKVLEGENKDVIEAQQKLYKERALPDLGNNIKCGNSLIGTDIYEVDLDEDDFNRINPFDWDSEFPEIMNNGKFDAVIGNPPYIRIQAMKEWAPIEVELYKEKYYSASKGNYDIYVVFVEKGLSILNENGLLGYIIPHKFFNTGYGEPLREIISENYIQKIVHFGHQQVFKKATTYTHLLFLGKTPKKWFKFIKVGNLNEWRTSNLGLEGKISQNKVTKKEWNFVLPQEEKLANKLKNMEKKLGDIARPFVGLQTSADRVYIMELNEKINDSNILMSRSLDNELVELENNLLHPLLKGAEISRYEEPSYIYKVLFPYKLESGSAIPIEEGVIKNNYPKTYNYLKRNKNKLINRSKCDSTNWWLFPYPKNLSLFGTPKILFKVLSNRGNFTLDLEGKYYFVGGGTAGGYGLTVPDNNSSKLKFLLGILNSKITTYYVNGIASVFKGGYYAYAKTSLKSFPVPDMDISKDSNVKNFNRMLNFVEKILQLKKITFKTPDAEQRIQRQIDATDKQIDKLVYELYDLEDDEIEIIENSV